jgi:hypothetical protein
MVTLRPFASGCWRCPKNHKNTSKGMVRSPTGQPSCWPTVSLWSETSSRADAPITSSRSLTSLPPLLRPPDCRAHWLPWLPQRVPARTKQLFSLLIVDGLVRWLRDNTERTSMRCNLGYVAHRPPVRSCVHSLVFLPRVLESRMDLEREKNVWIIPMG